AEALGDKSKDMYLVRARIQVERKNWDAALADYARAEPQPEDQLRIAQVLVFQNRPAAAESLYDAIVSADSTSGGARFALLAKGKMRFRAKDCPGAIPRAQGRNARGQRSDEASFYLGLA